MRILIYSWIHIIANTHHWEYALLWPRQLRVITRTESANIQIYAFFLQIHIIIIIFYKLSEPWLSLMKSCTKNWNWEKFWPALVLVYNFKTLSTLSPDKETVHIRYGCKSVINLKQNLCKAKCNLINVLKLNQMWQLGLYLKPPVPLFRTSNDIWSMPPLSVWIHVNYHNYQALLQHYKLGTKRDKYS